MIRLWANAVGSKCFPVASVPQLFPQLQRNLASAVTQANTASDVHHLDGKLDSLYKSIQIEVRCGEPAILKSYEWFVLTAAKNLGISVGQCWAPPKPYHDRFTLLKSVHIYKKHRVQYEIRTYFRYMSFLKLTGSTADTFLEYIQRNLPEGVALKVTKTAVEPLPEPIKKLTT